VLVEAAIAFPLLLLVALGLVQFALYQHAQNVVQAAAEDGARVAAAQGASAADGRQRAQGLLDAGLGKAAESPSVEVQFQPSQADPQRVTATVKARLRLILPIPLTDPYVQLQATAQMSKERFRAPL